jgi:hypothetical protein
LFSATEASTSEQKNIDHSIKSFMSIMEKNIEENSNSKNTDFATNLTNILILSRLLYLIYLFDKKKDLTPREFLIWQLNRNSKYSDSFFKYLYKNIGNIEKSIEFLIKILKESLKSKKISFALDEAHIFEALFEFRDKY